jgi:hypothetical protein
VLFGFTTGGRGSATGKSKPAATAKPAVLKWTGKHPNPEEALAGDGGRFRVHEYNSGTRTAARGRVHSPDG